jgi:UDP-hydrolysing UDP-N-acetyl-D-glucosamine 2-epimerase
MTTLAAVTVGRADYGILRPLVGALAAHFDIHLVAAGTHLCSASRDDLLSIARVGFPCAAMVATLPEGDDPVDIARAMGAGVVGFAEAYARLQPDLVVLIGDRFETLAAAAAAVPFGLALCHVHGGELTEGANDEQMRHAITKMSHLHFVAGVQEATRVVQMGEEPWRVTVSGAPALDQLRTVSLLPREELEGRVGLALDEPPILVTYHPETIDFTSAALHIDEVVGALDPFERPIVVTAPNVDTSNRVIRRCLEQWVAARQRAVLVETLGTQAYWSMMAIAGVLVGNSSSGIIEAASFKLPVVDVGRRQAGRHRPPNVIHAGNDRREIADAVSRALDPGFRRTLAELVNPYGDGHASERIARVLTETPLDRRLKTKRFHHLPVRGE